MLHCDEKYKVWLIGNRSKLGIDLKRRGCSIEIRITVSQKRESACSKNTWSVSLAQWPGHLPLGRRSEFKFEI